MCGLKGGKGGSGFIQNKGVCHPLREKGGEMVLRGLKVWEGVVYGV